MNRRLQRNDAISLCYRGGCIHATGKYAAIIVGAVVIMLACICLNALTVRIK